MSRAELGFGSSHDTRYIRKSRLLSKIEERTSIPSSNGAEPPPEPPSCPLPDREKEELPPPTGVGAMGASSAGCGGGVLSEGF